jgi:hypothetical protein
MNGQEMLLRLSMREVLAGRDPPLLADRARLPEPSPNVVSLNAKRTERITAQMMRGRSWPVAPAS